jgi:hypothetical protein
VAGARWCARAGKARRNAPCAVSRFRCWCLQSITPLGVAGRTGTTCAARHSRLEHQPTTDLDVRQFGIDLRACSEGSLGEQDQSLEPKYLQVERLIERFCGRDGFTTLDDGWTAKVTDVRNWFTFSASEKWTETGEEFEPFTDSGGKSGGQKEKLAYTILAAALAFQFGLGTGSQAGKGGGKAAGRSFRFVVINEAFGRGSDESARYGLELFQRTKLQLLIVTPLQKIHVIEPFVSHVGFVANTSGDDSQLRNMTIQEYREERDRRAGVFSLETVEAGRNTIGANTVPSVAVFARVEDEIAFIGKTRDSTRVAALAGQLTEIEPALRAWAVKRPLELLKLRDDALTAGRIAVWLRDNPAPGVFVRQLSLPGVHTKFVEKHRQIIDQLVAALGAGSSLVEPAPGLGTEPAERTEPAPRLGTEPGEPAGLPPLAEPPDVGLVPQPTQGVEGALGASSARTPAARFARRHGFIHPPELVRFRLLDAGQSVLGTARDITLTADSFSTLRLPVRTVIITENLVNFLALPDRPAALGLFGAGYGFTALRDAAWLQDCGVLFGPAVRLEQELVRWEWALPRLA